MAKDKLLLAIVGMPGSGKSEAVAYLQNKGIPAVRFGQLTDEELKKAELPLTEENEKIVRENLRKDYGMAVYAIRAEPKIKELLGKNKTIVIDGLYSWEEYVYFREKFPQLIVIYIYTQPEIRYQRLAKRLIRPLTEDQSQQRDIAEIEQLHKGGPIAIADHLIVNDEDVESLHKKIDALLSNLNII